MSEARVLRCVAVCCSVLQCVAGWSVDRITYKWVLQCVAMCCSVSQCIAVCCSLKCLSYHTYISEACVFQCVAVCCSVLQCAVWNVCRTTHTWMHECIRGNETCHTYIWIRQHTATHCNTLQHTATHCNTRHTQKWGMPLIWISHDTHRNKSRHTEKSLVSLVRMRHITLINTSWHTYEGHSHAYEWFISHTHTHIPHTNASFHR